MNRDDLLKERTETSNVDTIDKGRTSSNSEGTVGVDLFNTKGTASTDAEFGRIRNQFKHVIINLVVMRSSFVVFASKIVVNKSLSFLTEKKQISHVGYIDKHVAMEYEGSRGSTEGAMNCRSKCMGSCCQCVIDCLRSHMMSLRRMKMK